MRKDSNGYIVSCQRMGEELEIKAKIVIGADGPESRVGRWAGLKTAAKPKNMESAPSLKWQALNLKNHTE